MAALSNSRACVSLFDQEFIDLLRGARTIAKDLAHGKCNGEKLKLWNKESNHEKGNVQCIVQIGWWFCLHQFYQYVLLIKPIITCVQAHP